MVSLKWEPYACAYGEDPDQIKHLYSLNQGQKCVHQPSRDFRNLGVYFGKTKNLVKLVDAKGWT